MTELKPKVKAFVENNIDLIENDLVAFFKLASDELSTDEIANIADMLEDIEIDAIILQEQAFELVVKEYIEYYLNKLKYMKDKSNSWARLDYMLDGISNVGLGWKEAKQYVLTHQKELGLECRLLAPEYGWEGAGDYAFQWFDSNAFDQEYNYND